MRRSPSTAPRVEASPTELLLDDLDLRRGTRETVDEDEDDEEFEGFGPAVRAREAETGFGGAGRAREDAAASTAEVAQAKAEEPTERRSTKRGRASVPSWDEIVFGAKNDQS